ncbi:MAG: branched-chain amino acid ABC transporter permease [Dethiosulfovibrio peptidovorans]|nr:MAG: branched-chain amino acid ABC transporter permease [Dethiosulfovibrio peptidovorans]
MNKFAKVVLAVCFVLFLYWLPRFFTMDYYMHIFVMSEIYIVLALSLALVVGFAGQVSLGHAAFYGMGAYISAILSVRFGVSFWIAFWLAGFFSGLMSFCIGKLVLRLRGHVLAITTAFFGVLVTVIMNNWIDVTNGPMGIAGIPRPTPFSFFGWDFVFTTRIQYYYLGLFFVGGVVVLINKLVCSRLGDAMIAVRENEKLAKSVGIDVMKSKIFAFTLGGGLAGLAGSFYAHYILFISPVTFTINESINILVMVIFGGMNTIAGPIFGAISLTILPEFLRMAGELRLVVYGMALILFIIWLPRGIWGSIKVYLADKKS